LKVAPLAPNVAPEFTPLRPPTASFGPYSSFRGNSALAPELT
jgi:hypothetical protein